MSKVPESDVQTLLQIRLTERNGLLQRIQSTLENDPRVCAAWLFGSLGREEADALSDIDLFVIVEDAHLEVVKAERQTYVARPEFPVLILEAPQNAPKGGAYLMALYGGQAGPHQVDWYWQARSAALIPQQTSLLLDRVGLPHSDTPTHFEGYQPVPERTPLEAAAQAVNFFWVMLLITAKYAARSPHEERMGLLGFVQGPLREVEQFLGRDTSPDPQEASPHPDPETKLHLLRELAGRMEALMPQMAARGASVPVAIIPQAYRYFDLISGLCRR